MSTDPPRPVEMTLETRFVLLLLLQHPDRETHGHRVAERLTMPFEVACLVLDRLAAAGWLTDRQEPARDAPVHVYRLTADAVSMARRELAAGLTEVFTILAGRLGLSVDVLHGPAGRTCSVQAIAGNCRCGAQLLGSDAGLLRPMPRRSNNRPDQVRCAGHGDWLGKRLGHANPRPLL